MANITPLSAVNPIREEGVSPEKWNLIPGDDEIRKTVVDMEQRGIKF
jgi:hypothetical protein